MSQTSIIEIWFYLLTSSLNRSHNMVSQTFQLTVAIITTTITIIMMGICRGISTKWHFIHCFQIEFPRIRIWNSWFFTFEIIWLPSHEMWCICTGVPDQHQVWGVHGLYIGCISIGQYKIRWKRIYQGRVFTICHNHVVSQPLVRYSTFISLLACCSVYHFEMDSATADSVDSDPQLIHPWQ